MKARTMLITLLIAFLLFLTPLTAQQYDLLVKGGHVIDPKNEIDSAMDVAITGGKIARVAAIIPAAQAKKVVNASGLYVTPGLVDIHVHVYTGTGEKALTGDDSVYPDGFTFRSGVTTVVDVGSSGWRNFPDFKERVIDRSQTRVLVMLNVVAWGMSARGENNQALMNPEAIAETAKAYPDIIVGVKTAHYAGPEWVSVDRAVEAATKANIPVMVDFGADLDERPISELFLDHLRPGDIYTHTYSGLRREADVSTGRLNPAMQAGRKRGIFFDVGHGGLSFMWSVALPAFKEGFYPDSISTDLHTGSMNAGMKDMPNVMSKFLNNGVSLRDVIKMSTSNPAAQIKRLELGHLSEGAVADVTVLGVRTGTFGFSDSLGGGVPGTRKIEAEITIREGNVVWDLNGRAGLPWERVDYEAAFERYDESQTERLKNFKAKQRP